MLAQRQHANTSSTPASTLRLVHSSSAALHSQMTLEEPGAGAVSARELPRGRRVRLFGVEICDTTIRQAAAWIIDRASHKRRTDIAFLNAHSINVMNNDVGMQQSVARFDAVFADGAGMRIAARTAGVRLYDNVNGTDLFPVLCEMAVDAGTWIYLLGGREGVSEATAQRMSHRFPGLSFAGTRSGYFANEIEEEAAIDAINASGAQILLVGLGQPFQEAWIARNRHRLEVSVVIAVGGLFDYYSGRIARAPRVLRHVGMEWAWRLAMEPTRLARRYLIGNLTFMLRLCALRLLSPQQFDQGPYGPAPQAT